jgi:hypothetical protein
MSLQSKPAQQGRGQQNQPTQQSVRRNPVPPESAEQGLPRRKPPRQKPSKQGSAWEKTFQLEPLKQESAVQEPSSEFPTDNGHRRPTTDRSP